jgi:hypothetical protein
MIVKALFDDLQLAALKLKGLALEHRMADAHARSLEYSSQNSGLPKSGIAHRLVPAWDLQTVPSSLQQFGRTKILASVGIRHIRDAGDQDRDSQSFPFLLVSYQVMDGISSVHIAAL